MPLITLGVFLLHGSQGGGSLPFSHSSVIGNLVTVLNFKFWHLYGTAIHLLARRTARGFLRNPLIVLNTNNIYIHWDETKFTAGFWGWLRDSLTLNFLRVLPPPRILGFCCGQGVFCPWSSLLFTEFVLQQTSHLSFLPRPPSHPILTPLESSICAVPFGSHTIKEPLDLWSLSEELFCL